jgi:polysaccharide export outer membrane protein
MQFSEKKTNLYLNTYFASYMKFYFKFFFSLMLLYSSCVSYKKTLYFQQIKDSTYAPKAIEQTYKIQYGDVLSIKILTPDSKSAEMFDISKSTTTTATPASIYLNNYSVSDSGMVHLPLLGGLLVQGKTIEQIDSMVTLKANEYFNFSSVEIKLASFKFVALGEFRTPGYTYVYNSRCTLFEAIALAGDATDFANKKKVVLIRKNEDGSERVFKLDLTDFSVYNSEAYYVYPNDKIYITPQKAKVDSKNIQYITLGFAGISTILLVINFISRQ